MVFDCDLARTKMYIRRSSIDVPIYVRNSSKLHEINLPMILSLAHRLSVETSSMIKSEYFS
jgi:hypothetical protein